jgi:hypothetical protein
MEDQPLPQDVLRLIEDALPSMDHVEILFRVCRESPLRADSLAQTVHIEPGRVAAVLRDLQRAHLITNDDGRCRITQSARDRAAVEQFAEAFNARPIALIRAMQERSSPLRSFADAFRLRREDSR